MDNRPIGVFDSGVGGLTTVRELGNLLPGEDVIYFGDTARVPYGTRSRETICRYALQIVRYLASLDVKAVVAACGTISTNLEEEAVTSQIPGVPYINVLAPAVKAAALRTKNGRVGVMATPASIRSGAYERKLREVLPGADIFGQACPLLVPLVESGLTDFGNRITRLTLEMYLEPLMEAEVDTIILGCTHYPVLYNMIADMTDGVSLVDAGACAAGETRGVLRENGMLSGREAGSVAYRVTDTVENFRSVAENFLFRDIGGQCGRIDLETLERDFI